MMFQRSSAYSTTTPHQTFMSTNAPLLGSQVTNKNNNAQLLFSQQPSWARSSMPNKRVYPADDDEVGQYANKRICSGSDTSTSFPRQSKLSATTVSGGKRTRETMTPGFDGIINKRSRHAIQPADDGTGMMDLDAKPNSITATAAPHPVTSPVEWNHESPLWVIPYQPRAISNNNDKWPPTPTNAMSSNFARSERRLTDRSLIPPGEHQLVLWEPKEEVIRRALLKEECKFQEEEEDEAMCDS